MSGGHINTLLDLWAASLAKHDDKPPFHSHGDMYDTIDATPLGDVKWESFSLCYNGNVPEGEVPSWMKSEFDVWFRDPRTIIRNLLSNPDFDNEFDYSPVQEYDMEGNHRFQNFMSGDWAWKQAVSTCSLPQLHYLTYSLTRTLYPKILKHGDLCLCPSFWAATRRQCLSPLATTSIGRYIYPLGTFITMCDVHIAMELYSWDS
jgi:Plavaka transposase